MFCKECGTENLDTQVECIKCKTIINSNFPLDGAERVMIIGFFLGLVATIFFGIIPIAICLGLLFIIKKDKSIKSLESGKKIFLGYLITLGFILSIFCFVSAQNSYEYYLKYLSGDYIFGRDYIYDVYIYVVLGVIVVPLVTYIIYKISNILYFNILKKHGEWVINNGVFSDEINLNNNSTNIVGRDNLSSYSVVDEMLKWNALLEKGLITEEEFIKAKEKILDGKL